MPNDNQLEGPNLKWGEPVGTWEIVVLPEGALLVHRQRQANGGLLQMSLPMSTKDLAEMAGLLGMLTFSDHRVEVPDGKILIN